MLGADETNNQCRHANNAYAECIQDVENCDYLGVPAVQDAIFEQFRHALTRHDLNICLA